MSDMDSGIFFGIGVGPGDPELLTMKAFRLIVEADCIAYLVNGLGESQAANIAAMALAVCQHTPRITIPMPMKIERDDANRAYDAAAEQIRQRVEAGEKVVFLCEGDPLLFGSFNYLLERLHDLPCEVVPGISSVNAAAAVALQPLAQLDSQLAIISARSSDEQILEALNKHDSVVILKAGPNRAQLLQLLRDAGRYEDATYIEYATRENQKVITDLDLLTSDKGPYFSLLLISGASAS